MTVSFEEAEGIIKRIKKENRDHINLIKEDVAIQKKLSKVIHSHKLILHHPFQFFTTIALSFLGRERNVMADKKNVDFFPQLISLL